MSEVRGYDVDDRTKVLVDRELDKYYYYLELSEMSIDDEAYYMVPAIEYDRIVSSPTNNISNTTQMRAIELAEGFQKRAEAKAKVRAIEKGFERAANTSRTDRAEQLREDLFKNMVNKTPRHNFLRDPRTFTKYRRRAYFFIAMELGLIEKIC